MKRRVFYVLIAGYFFVGAFSLFVNEGFQASVERCLGAVAAEQSSSGIRDTLAADSVDKNGSPYNSRTDDLQKGYHWTHITWRYRSASYGYDKAVYIPLDLLLLSALVLLVRFSDKKTNNRKK